MSIKQKIFNTLANKGYITDSDLYKIYGQEPNFATAEEYKRQWKSLSNDRAYFENKDIARIENYRRNYKAQLRGEEFWHRISKMYFEEIRPQFKKDNSRPDLKEIKMYYAPEYYYKGNRLYNIKYYTDSIMGYDLMANWKNPEENGREQLGKFYLKDLKVIPN